MLLTGFDALEPADVRAEFEQAFRRFAQSLDMLLPDPRALSYTGDARWLGKIRAAAAAKYRDGKIDVSDCGAKVKKLIEEAVIAEGIEILVKQVSLFAPDFEEKLKALATDEARASEMEHAIKDEIHVKLDEDPAFYRSLRERLEQILEDRKARRIDAAAQLKLFESLRVEMGDRVGAAARLGLSPRAMAIYGVLTKPTVRKLSEPESPGYVALDDATKELVTLIEEQLDALTNIVDWVHKDDVQREMRRLTKRQLRAARYGDDEVDSLAERVVDLLKRRSAH